MCTVRVKIAEAERSRFDEIFCVCRTWCLTWMIWKRGSQSCLEHQAKSNWFKKSWREKRLKWWAKGTWCRYRMHVCFSGCQKAKTLADWNLYVLLSRPGALLAFIHISPNVLKGKSEIKKISGSLGTRCIKMCFQAVIHKWQQQAWSRGHLYFSISDPQLLSSKNTTYTNPRRSQNTAVEAVNRFMMLRLLASLRAKRDSHKVPPNLKLWFRLTFII